MLDLIFDDLPPTHLSQANNYQEFGHFVRIISGGNGIATVCLAQTSRTKHAPTFQLMRGKRGNMTKRKELTKKIRFEVFKRDSFTCQYCGSEAPKVVLEVDHIKPVSKGGGNSIANLVTSCRSCNAGKSNRELSDDSVVRKQKKQLNKLNAHRQQLEMMINWQEELKEVENLATEKICQWVQSDFGHYYSPNQNGIQKIKSWQRKFSLEEINEAISICSEQYLLYDEEGNPTSDSWNKAFDYIPKVCMGRRRQKENPEQFRVAYIKGILRNRQFYINHRIYHAMVNEALQVGVTIDLIESIAKSAKHWSDFRKQVQFYTYPESEEA